MLPQPLATHFPRSVLIFLLTIVAPEPAYATPDIVGALLLTAALLFLLVAPPATDAEPALASRLELPGVPLQTLATPFLLPARIATTAPLWNVYVPLATLGALLKKLALLFLLAVPPMTTAETA